MNEILLYKTDNAEVKVEILLQNENLWLTQAKMAELFDVQKAAISKHLKNIFADGELQESSVVSKMETTASDGAIAGKEQTKAGETRPGHVHEGLGGKAKRFPSIQRARYP